MRRLMLFIVTLFLFITACGKSPTELSYGNTYRLIVGNPHSNPQQTLTFNIFINEEFVAFIPCEPDGFLDEIGYFPEENSTHFQSYFADSSYGYELFDDTTINTINCDSIIFIIGSPYLVYYED